jgi:soluble lytic murein transglycosylase-like protein
MAALPLATVLVLAASCQSVVAPATIAGIAKHESSLDPAAIHANRDGSIDVGLMQINSRNFAWLSLNAQTALDPCQSIRAAGQLLASFSRYNTGSPSAGLSYAGSVSAAVAQVKSEASPIPAAPPASAPAARAYPLETPGITPKDVSFSTVRSKRN